MTSETSLGLDLGALSAALIATVPSSCAGSAASAPLNEPTGVRAALAITMSVSLAMGNSFGGLAVGDQVLIWRRPDRNQCNAARCAGNASRSCCTAAIATSG